MVDGSKSGPEHTASLRANNEYIFVDVGLTHSQTTDRNYDVLFLSQHQKTFDRVFQQSFTFCLLS